MGAVRGMLPWALAAALPFCGLGAVPVLAAEPWALTPLVPVRGGDFVHPGSNDGLRLHVDAFALERTPVTWRQYKRVMAGTPHWTPLLATHEAEFPPDAPVTWVTYDDALAYATRVGRRLPTELEWECAAAAGHTRVAFELSPEEAAELSWYGGAKKEPRPVGQGRPNAFGLYDMHGNVWEWVEDMAGNYARQDPRDPDAGVDNLGCGNVSYSNGSYAWFLRAAVRSASRRDHPMRFRGFRCAL